MKSLVNMDPARTIIEMIGGVDVTSRITGKHISRVYRWMYPHERGGTGGTIPQPEALKLLDYAREHAIPLTSDDFMQKPAPAQEGASA